MKITGKTRLERRAMAIFNSQQYSCPPLTTDERWMTVNSLLQIANLAKFAAEIIRTESVSLKCELFPDDGDDVNEDYINWDTHFELWTKYGKNRVRLTHAGMAMAHDLFEVGQLVGSRFPQLPELGFKLRMLP